MAKISTYGPDGTLTNKDKVLGSSYIRTVNNVDEFETKNFTLEELNGFFSAEGSALTIGLKDNGGIVRETINNTTKLAIDLGASSITGQLANSDLANSSITINGTAISLGGTVTTPNTQLTDAQVRSKISVTGGGASYNSSTGVITLPSQFTLAQNNVTNASVSGQTLTLTRQSASDITFTPTANDFTNTLKTKLDGIATGAEVNVQANWNETNSGSDAFIQNKPTLFSGDYDDLTNKPTLLQLGTTSTTALAGNTTTISSAQSTKLGHISVTQAVDLDTIESDTTTNNAKTSFPGFGTTSGTALEGNTSLFSGAYNDLTGKPTIPSGNQIIDWTTDQGSTNIHTGNYNNTQLTDAQVRSKISGTGLISYNSTTGVISTTANNYTLPLATSSARGGIKIGYTESGKNYPVELDSEKAYVNVPWTDTVYTLPTASSSTLGGVKVGGNLTIDGDGVLNVGAIALTTVQTAANQTAHLALTAQEGDIVVRSDQNKSYVHNGGTAGTMADYTLLLTPTDAVLSVTTSDGTYINLTPNSAATGAITVTADLSATNGTSDTTTRFLSQDNTWDVPSYTTETYTQHDNISAADSVNNSGRTYIQDITLDSNGHVTGITSATETVVNTDTNTNQLTEWTLRDSDNDDVTVDHDTFVKFVAATGTLGTNITGAGTTGDPYVVTITSPDSTIANTFRTVEVDTNGNGSANNTLGDSETLRFKKGSNITLSEAAGIITISSTNTTYVSSDFTHDDLTGFVANEHIDWTTDQGNTNIHTSNYNNTTYSDGDGLDLNGTVFSHTDTSSQSSVNNSGRTYIQDITLDTYGHVTGLTSATETVTNSFRTIEVDGTSIGSTTTLDLVAGNNITLSESSGEVTIDATNTNILSGGTITGNVTVNGDMTFEDGHYIKLGTGADFLARHNGTNTTFVNVTGDYYIQNQAVDKDLYLGINDNSTVRNLIMLDGDTSQIKLLETTLIQDGSGNADLYLGNIIGPSSSDKGARFHSNNSDFYMDFQGDSTQNWFFRDYDGSGGTHTRFAFDFVNAKFTAGGDVIAFGSPSDKTLKENIKPINNALDKVEKLQGVTFDWKEQDITNLKEDIGFIAQDVKEVLPELVRENENGKLSLRHQGIIPVLLEAIKELSDKVKALENGSTK